MEISLYSRLLKKMVARLSSRMKIFKFLSQLKLFAIVCVITISALICVAFLTFRYVHNIPNISNKKFAKNKQASVKSAIYYEIKKLLALKTSLTPRILANSAVDNSTCERASRSISAWCSFNLNITKRVV